MADLDEQSVSVSSPAEMVGGHRVVSMAGKPPPLTPGLYWVDLPCPRCGSIETVAVVLSAVLTTPTDDQPSLKLRSRSKATDHDCGQSRMLDTSDLLPLDATP